MKMMKRTLIFFKPEYADLAVKLRDHYRAHGHEKANIISEEVQDDVEYAREMQYDEAIFIEDRDTVTVHDLRSGSTNRLPVSDVYYKDPGSGRDGGMMNKDTLHILAEAISDVGSWWCWGVNEDTVQLEFCDVMLYDETKQANEPHTTDVLAVRFSGHAFAVFFDDLDEADWHIRFRDDDSVLYPVDAYCLGFDDLKEAEALLNAYDHRTAVKDFSGLETIAAAKHFLCAKCDDVGLIVGGDEILVAGRKGRYTEEEIKTASEKWWGYWKDYWRLRETENACPKDYACEITIPVSED